MDFLIELGGWVAASYFLGLLALGLVIYCTGIIYTVLRCWIIPIVKRYILGRRF